MICLSSLCTTWYASSNFFFLDKFHTSGSRKATSSRKPAKLEGETSIQEELGNEKTNFAKKSSAQFSILLTKDK